jgi:hypothetical protein
MSKQADIESGLFLAKHHYYLMDSTFPEKDVQRLSQPQVDLVFAAGLPRLRLNRWTAVARAGTLRACVVTNWSNLQLKSALEGPVALSAPLPLYCISIIA